jgi:hypothetical protein
MDAISESASKIFTHEAMALARANGRGVNVFRPAEAAAFLGVSVLVIKDAMSDYCRSSGRRGLAHFQCGKGAMIRRIAIENWMIGLENRTATH